MLMAIFFLFSSAKIFSNTVLNFSLGYIYLAHLSFSIKFSLSDAMTSIGFNN
jgi:hypothetical protein